MIPRRDFLKLATAGVVGAACAWAAPPRRPNTVGSDPMSSSIADAVFQLGLR
ncbi:MAG: twin-arginine translocation signal domain-containing protein [Bryobacteraceae bacterium]